MNVVDKEKCDKDPVTNLSAYFCPLKFPRLYRNTILYRFPFLYTFFSLYKIRKKKKHLNITFHYYLIQVNNE